MDVAAFYLCMETGLPVRILNIHRPGILERAVLGQDVGSLVAPGS